MKILFILQFDSFINTLLPVHDQLYKEKYNVKIILFKHWRKKNWISDEIKLLLKKYIYVISSRKKILDELNNNYNVVIVGSMGGITAAHANQEHLPKKLRFLRVVTNITCSRSCLHV